MEHAAVPSGTRLGIVRGISYGLWGEPDGFVEQMRELGAGLVRLYVYWAQIEPEPGHYRWNVVDAMLAQLDGSEEVWVTFCSSSPWGTREKTDFLPPSPAHDPAVYQEAVRRLVEHCAGRVHYWQCDNEPSNAGMLWAGTAEEYVTQLGALHRAVRATDPRAAVVLGGCGYDVFASPEPSPQREFFDHLVREGREHFDLFSAHLYGDPTRIPEYLETARAMMRAHGYEKPVVVGEYNGPALFQFPAAEAVLQQVLMAAFTDASQVANSTGELQAQHAGQTPEYRAMTALYARMPELPETLQMFMADCPPELAERRRRMSCRDIVMRNLLALSCGVRRTACWNLGPEIPDYEDPYRMMHLMFATFALMDYRNGTLSHRHPAADTFARLTGHLAGVQAVTRVELAGHPDVYAFDVQRAGRPAQFVLWNHGDPFHGEDEPPVPVSLPWSTTAATAVDVFGAEHQTEVRGGRLHLTLALTPVFVTATGH